MIPGEQSDGFSLIELLVVVALTSILAIGATLALPRSRAVIDQSVADFEGDVQDLSWRAMLSGTDHALAPAGTGWHLMMRKTDGSWTELADRAYPGLSVAGSRVVLHSDGRVGAGALELRDDEDVTQCTAQGGGRAQCRVDK